MTAAAAAPSTLHFVVARSDADRVPAFRVLQASFPFPAGAKLGGKAPFRGKRGQAAQTAALAALETGAPQRQRYRVGDDDEWVDARPMPHPGTGEPVAVSLSVSTETKPSEPSPLDNIPLWVWELPAEAGPPRLYLSPTAIDYFRIDAVTTDRSVYGPLDFFSSFPVISQALPHLDWLYSPYYEQDGSAPTWHQTSRVFEWNGVPTDRVSSLTEIRTRDRAVVGAGTVTSVYSSGGASVVGADALLANSLAAADDRHVVLLDVRFPNAIYVIRWLSGPPATFGNGLSTGQRSGIHPDDSERIAMQIASGRAAGEAVWEPARIRSSDGSYVAGQFRGWFLDHVTAPGIVVAEVLELGTAD